MSCSIFSKIHNKKDVFPGRFKVFLKKISILSFTESTCYKKIEFFSKKIWSIQKKVVYLYQKTKQKRTMEFKSKSAIESAIREMITTNPQRAIKAMLRIYEYQTADEQESGDVGEFNGVGFAGTDSVILTSFCKQYQKYGRLSEKQMEIVLKKIGKYAGQRTRHAIENGRYGKKRKVRVAAK